MIIFLIFTFFFAENSLFLFPFNDLKCLRYIIVQLFVSLFSFCSILFFLQSFVGDSLLLNPFLIHLENSLLCLLINACSCL